MFIHDYASLHVIFFPQSLGVQLLTLLRLPSRTLLKCSILRTERLLTCEQPVPAIMQRLFNIGSTIYFYEVSEVDPQRREHRSVSRNITYSNVVMLDERVTYTADTADPGRTRFEQEAAVDVRGGMASVRSYVEDFCVNRFQANAEKVACGVASSSSSSSSLRHCH